MKYDVCEVKNNLEMLLSKDDVAITSEKVSLFHLKSVIEASMEKFGLASYEAVLRTKINNKVSFFGKESRIDNISFYSSYPVREMGITLRLAKRGVGPLLVEYDNDNRVFTRSTESIHIPTVEFLKENFNDDFEVAFELMSDACEYFNSEFCSSRYSHMGNINVVVPGTGIDVYLKHIGADKMMSNISLPELDDSIIHFSKDFDLHSVVQDNRESILKKTPVLTKSLPSQYNNCIRDYYKKL